MRIQAGVNFNYIKIKPFSFEDMMFDILDFSAKVFVEEISWRIPWWTGQARGTLLPIVKMLQLDISLLYRNIKINRSRSNKNLYTGAQQSDIHKYKSGGAYVFEYTSYVDYMAENEYIDQPATPNQQRLRAWRILEETKPIIQNRINEEINKTLKSKFKNLYIKVK